MNEARASPIEIRRSQINSPLEDGHRTRELVRIQGKLDLNNSDVREFRRLRGFYPNLASKIIQNAPYERVEDVLEIPGLSDSQLERLQANLDEFFVTDIEASMNAGGDRYNPGLY